MFTGIIEDKGKVLKVEYRGQEKRLTLEVPFDLTGVQLGDSINVNGVCLTVVEKQRETIGVDLSSETLQKTNLAKVQEGDKVNLERALRLSDRLGGHIVTGHIDGIGVITEKRMERNFLQLRIRVPQVRLKICSTERVDCHRRNQFDGKRIQRGGDLPDAYSLHP